MVCGCSRERDDELVNKISYYVREVLKLLGENPDRDNVAETPVRYAKMLLELTRGLRSEAPKVKFFRIPERAANNIITVRDIEFTALCEHHLLPIIGTVSVSYKPREPMVPGLSKIPRLIRWLSSRLILQERFTQDLADKLLEAIRAKFVYCRVCALHLCTFLRGVRERRMYVMTEAFSGELDVDLDVLRRITVCRRPLLA